MLQKMSTVDNQVNDISVCANCGKEGANNVCNKCKQVKYCNAVCKKVHKKKHKKQCEEYIKLATEKHNEELRIAAELHDEKLFKEPPSQHGDCPICFLRIPNLNTGWRYQSCCGKVVCRGCAYAPVYDNQGNKVDSNKCPYCRVPDPISDEECIERGRILRMDMQQKKITQKHYNPIKNTWMKLRVYRGMKLLRAMRTIVIISIGFPIIIAAGYLCLGDFMTRLRARSRQGYSISKSS